MKTLRDIAGICEVSISTVSLVLNKPHKISKEVRDKVYKVIREVGYFKKKADRIQQIGLVFTWFKNYYFGEFYNEVLFGILEKASEIGFSTKIINNFDVEYAEICDVQGLILIGKIPNAYYKKAQKFKIPFINVGHPHPNFPDIPSVYFERTSDTKKIVEFIRSCGHRNIAVLNGETDPSDIISQEYLKAIEQTNPDYSEDLVFQTNYSEPQTVEIALNEIISHKPKITAVMCSNDMIAYNLYRAAKKYGTDIPNDISVTGYDFISSPSHLDLPPPKLTTVYGDRIHLGRQSVDLLFDQISGIKNKEKLIKLPGKVVIGDSVKRL